MKLSRREHDGHRGDRILRTSLKQLPADGYLKIIFARESQISVSLHLFLGERFGRFLSQNSCHNMIHCVDIIIESPV
jgi:hypothetical protein